MRDLINLVQYLSEDQTLSPGNLLSVRKRFDNFIRYIQDGKPFASADGTKVVIDPSEADRMLALDAEEKFGGTIKLKIKDSEKTVGLGKLLKTPDFGGQASTGDEGEEVGKESALMKPSQIGICDRDIPAADFGDEIINNTVLQSTEYGRVVIDMAKTIVEGGKPVIPQDVRKNKAIRGSIIDYAGEYLGVLALVHGVSRFPRKNSFQQWLGGNVMDLTLRFPSKANTNIADSYASIVNPDTEHSINISSKGQGGGAPPSVSGLKIPNDLKQNEHFKAAIDFIELCQRKDIPSPSTISQVFLAMNLLMDVAPDSIPEKFEPFLPWRPSIVDEVVESINEFKRGRDPGLGRFEDLWTDIKFKGQASDGGKLTHAVKLAVMKAVNEGQAIPEFGAAVLSILGMNFVQQYTDYDPKTGVVSFATQWPATLKGKITLESKSGGTDPTKGGFSFKLADNEPKTDLEPPVETTYADDARRRTGTDDTADLEKAADSDSGVLTKKQTGDVGRGKRKK